MSTGDADRLRHQRPHFFGVEGLVERQAREQASPQVDVFIRHKRAQCQTLPSLPQVLDVLIGDAVPSDHPHREVKGIGRTDLLRIRAVLQQVQEHGVHLARSETSQARLDEPSGTAGVWLRNGSADHRRKQALGHLRLRSHCLCYEPFARLIFQGGDQPIHILEPPVLEGGSGAAQDLIPPLVFAGSLRRQIFLVKSFPAHVHRHSSVLSSGPATTRSSQSWKSSAIW